MTDQIRGNRHQRVYIPYSASLQEDSQDQQDFHQYIDIFKRRQSSTTIEYGYFFYSLLNVWF